MCTNLNQEKLEHVACQGCVCVYALLEGSAEGGGDALLCITYLMLTIVIISRERVN